MQLPNQIKIGGFIIQVQEKSNLMTDRMELGNYEPRTQVINIERDSSNQQKEETLVHEILEAVIAIYDLKLEHHALSILATVLHQVFKDNELSFR